MSGMAEAKTLGLAQIARLWRCSAGSGVFAIVALDHQDSLRRAFNPQAPAVVTMADIGSFKEDVAAALADAASGILLDAPTGIPAVLPAGHARHCGLLVAIERSDYALQPMPVALEIEPGWSVAQVARLGAAGVKLFVYDDPTQREISASQDTLIRQIASDCRTYDLPLFSEPIVISGDKDENMTKRVIAAAIRQQELGATVLKLEFPLEIQSHPAEEDWRAACRELSSALVIPWVLLSAGVDFSTFARQLEIACQAGASGFMVGRALWGEATACPTQADRRIWLHEVARPRLKLLSSIAHVYARPWQEFYAKPNPINDWYLRQ